MFSRINLFLFILLIVVFSASLVQADLSKADEQEINAYRLTEKKITQFGEATKNLLEAFQKNPKLFEGADKKEAESMAAMVNATNSIPDAKKAIEDAGMTAKEYWTFQMAMIYAGTGNMVLKSGGQLPEGFSKENVEFFRTHEAEFMKLDKDIKALHKASDKASSSSEEEEMEEEESEEQQN